MKKTLLSLVLLLTAIAVGAQDYEPVVVNSIDRAMFTYTFNGKQTTMGCPASGFTTEDLSGTVAENFKIDDVKVAVTGSINDVYIVAGEYKEGTKQQDVEISYVPLTSNGNDIWYLSETTLARMGDGWIVKDNDRSTATRYFRFYFVANKDSESPIYYDNGGNHYIIKFYTEGENGGGGGGQSGNITFYDSNTATLNLKMEGGASDNVTYTYLGDGTRDIKDNPGQITSLKINGFTLRLQRSSADLNIESVSVQYKIYEEGSDGQWNTLNYSYQEDEDGNILNKKYTSILSTGNLAGGLTSGKNYVLEIKYQVIDSNGNYYFFQPSKDYGMFKFSVKENSIAINETNFPDEVFRNWVLSQDYGKDGVLTEDEIATVTSISVGYGDIIQTMQGIEFFTALKYLDVSSRNVTSLDVSKNTALESLNCSYNYLTSLDVSQNKALTYLRCFGNGITSLDLSNNTMLRELNCNYNELTTLDLSKNTALRWVDCCKNKITSLNVSNNTSLSWLMCYNNQLTSLDISGCPNLTSISIYCNQIKGAAMDKFVEGLPTLDYEDRMGVIYFENEGNVMTTTQAAAAKAKGFTPFYAINEDEWKEYAGSEPEVKKCATPTITYEDGKLTFSCDTEDAEIHYEYGSKGIGYEVDAPRIIIFRVYASKEGYEDSDVTTMEIEVGSTAKKGDVNEDGIVNGTDIQEVINIIVND